MTGRIGAEGSTMGRMGRSFSRQVLVDRDDEGKLLWIPDSKTEAGRRTLQVPELLRPMLNELARG